jgi:hypothetical protein
VSHVFKFGGPFQVRVTVRGSGGASRRCASGCTGTDDVDVTVGEAPPPPPIAPPGAGAGTGTGTGTGAGSGSGGGQGGTSGSGSGSGSDPTTTQPAPAVKKKPKPKPKPPPPPEKPFGVTVSGVLIDDLGADVKKLPGGTPVGGTEGAPEPPDHTVRTGIAIPVSAVLALSLFILGALRERRGVKLRLA